MNLLKIIIYIVVAFFTSMAFGQVSKDSELYSTILELDNTYFTAYNECDMETQAAMFDEDLEFYHDKGGLATDKKAILKSIETNICGKVTRTLVEDSVEVHAINDFGAVQIGLHTFFNKEEPDAESKPSEFIAIWKKTNNQWLMHRVISLH